MNKNELTNEQIKSLTIEDVYLSYSGKPGCACGCNGNYRVNPAYIEYATKERGYAYEAEDINLQSVKRVLKQVQQNIDKVTGRARRVDEEFASVELENEYGTRRVYTIYITPAVAERIRSEVR